MSHCVMRASAAGRDVLAVRFFQQDALKTSLMALQNSQENFQSRLKLPRGLSDTTRRLQELPLRSTQPKLAKKPCFEALFKHLTTI